MSTAAPRGPRFAAIPEGLHRCQPPQRGIKGQVHDCWCGRRWVATSGLTIRDNRITSLRPDWQYVERLHPMPPRRPGGVSPGSSRRWT